MASTIQSTPPANEEAAKPRSSQRSVEHLEMPEATIPVSLDWRYLISLVVLHLLALLAFFPTSLAGRA